MATAGTVRRGKKEVREPVKEATRARLLQAAGEVFAAKGFGGATVREICERAGANVAAVNYHFRDKEELYLAVFREQGCLASDERAAGLAAVAKSGMKPREKLAGFVFGFLNNLLAPGRPSWQGRLMAREMVEPTAALDVVVKEFIRPTFGVLRGILSELLETETDSQVVREIGASVIGQCMFYKHAEPVIKRLYPELKYSAESITEIARHIAVFSLAAIDGVMAERKAKAGKKGGAK